MSDHNVSCPHFPFFDRPIPNLGSWNYVLNEEEIDQLKREEKVKAKKIRKKFAERNWQNWIE